MSSSGPVKAPTCTALHRASAPCLTPDISQLNNLSMAFYHLSGTDKSKHFDTQGHHHGSYSSFVHLICSPPQYICVPAISFSCPLLLDLFTAPQNFTYGGCLITFLAGKVACVFSFSASSLQLFLALLDRMRLFPRPHEH